MFRSILVANRGEIACRIINTAKKLNLRTIAIFSKDDEKHRHVAIADSSVMIGEGLASTSYLSIDSILEAAKETGVEALHPGYGFLSEKPRFARACKEAGLVFVGPSADCIALMSDKAKAKRTMRDAGVPCIPGYEGPDLSDSSLLQAAEGIGFPIMIKATAGGGGHGMRLVKTRAELISALDLTRAEASAAFGSEELILEKVITHARHVEIQICGDSFGNLVHFGDRDCSIQRRYQKIIEEAPCSSIPSDIRARLAEVALQVARTINYTSLGTVEFLVDKNNKFFFLEMNTRIQVEHPVTEMVTGCDLVETQIKIAQGIPLEFTQKHIRMAGHAMEARLYAEDPVNAFLPSSGPIVLWQAPVGTGIRVDHGIQQGQNVSTFYDPMLAKIISWGKTRSIARKKLVQALIETVLFGPVTNRDFLIAALQSDALVRGRIETDFVEEELVIESSEWSSVNRYYAAAAAVLLYVSQRDIFFSLSHLVSPLLSNWSSTGKLRSHYVLTCRQREFSMTVCPDGRQYVVEQGGERIAVELIRYDSEFALLRTDRCELSVRYLVAHQKVFFAAASFSLAFSVGRAGAGEVERRGHGKNVVAPMHGRVARISVVVGQVITEGQEVAVLEAMKMQHPIVSNVSGAITAVYIKVGDQIPTGEVLFEIDVLDSLAESKRL